VHGGGVVAALDSIAAALGQAPAPRVLEGRLTAAVPLDTPLLLDASRADGSVSVVLLEDQQTLTTGTVSPLRAPARPPARWGGGKDGWRLPMSEDCLACGTRNALGLQVALAFDEEGVWARFRPRAPWGAATGRLHPAAAPVILDEVAWWLGALVMKEGGVTNRLSVTLHRPDSPFGEPLLASGRFEDVKPVDRRRTFWRIACALLTEPGEILASASIVFRGGPEYSDRQMPYFRDRTPAEVFRRMFPDHAR
jgi:hypothetical protein